MCLESSAVFKTEADPEHSNSINTQYLHNEQREKQKYENILENINRNIQTILDSPGFNEDSCRQGLVKDILDVLGTSATVIEVIDRLTDMDLLELTEDVANIDIITGKDVTPVPTAEEAMVDIVNQNIKKYCNDPNYAGNETVRRKVKTVLGILVEATSEDDLIGKI